MIRRMLIGGITSLMLIGLPSLGHAQVSVSIGINLPLRSWYPFRRLRSCTLPPWARTTSSTGVNTTYSPTP
jgi:hypothetical protein